MPNYLMAGGARLTVRPGRFVAIGDSFTEGVGDWDPRLPNGVRGWADRVAKQLSKVDPRWEYANLAIRSKKLGPIVEEQIDHALALEPTLISFYAGGNDILELRQDMDDLLERYSAAVDRLCSSGAQVVLFTGFDVPLHPLLGAMKRRNHVFNDAVRQIVKDNADRGAVLLDYWTLDAYRDRRMWDDDKLHMNRAGHRYLAIQFLELFGIDHFLEFEPFGPSQRVGPVGYTVREVEWWREVVMPMFGRRMRGVTLGDTLSPRWPELIRPAEGMKRIYRKRLKVESHLGALIT
ncbi:lysophospholipase L1-like esterase [Neomicrococcus aestuarii]|uniref:Lysophospholipase L1-like esterase n=1 Tax=Neomicrococcus aestuarii TaxID=556325 RepID=A0A7W8WZ53_9MICC|nr:SGNH/GDSL hydrolase family protein [Neomicrococcus aestuarii]MBB5512991.1 lysophospholipase L1-like esterase [Neomicrococcus aestuarii]